MQMQSKSVVSSVFAVICAAGLIHCGTPSSNDGGDAMVVDAPSPTDVREGGTSASRAGAECMDDNACGGAPLACDTTIAGGFCTANCMNGTPAMEAQQCGGAGSTCLTAGDGAQAQSNCTKTCRTRTANSGCRAGQMCTGFWGTHEGGVPDTAGCTPFCSMDSHCAAGERCNVRSGECGAMGVNMALLADGEPCRVPGNNQPDPCRGICFTIINGNPNGVCGSIIDLSKTTDCPDDPMNIPALAADGDNLAFCNFRSCSESQCCRGGLACEGQNGEGFCVTDDPMTPNIACTAGGDAGADAGAVDSGVVADVPNG